MTKYILIKSIRKEKTKCPEKGDTWFTYKIQPAHYAASFLAEQASEFMKDRKKSMFKSPLKLTILGSNGNEVSCIQLTGDKKYVTDFIQEFAVHEEFNTHWYWREIDRLYAKIELKY